MGQLARLFSIKDKLYKLCLISFILNILIDIKIVVDIKIHARFVSL